MRPTLLAILIATPLLAAPVFADDTQTSPAAAPTVQNDPNHVVCRAGQKPVGSMLPGPRICHTQREWDDLSEQSRRNLEMNQNKGFQNGVPGG